MGRLTATYLKMKRSKLQFKIKNWIVPLLVSIGLFWFIRPVMAQLDEQHQSLRDYLSENNVDIGIEVVGGFSRVFYQYEGNKKYISTEGQNSKQVSTDGKYIVWVTQRNDEPGQVYLYDITSGVAIQITHSGTNSNPKAGSGGRVVWEAWVADEDGGKWQIFLFDGMKITQLTSGDLSVNPEIEGDFITYARRDITGTWRSVVYSLGTNESKEVATGISSKHPKIKNGKVLLAEGKEQFPLTVEDLFVLDLAPLTVSDEVTSEDIVSELEATLSTQIETEITPTVSPTLQVPGVNEGSDLFDR